MRNQKEQALEYKLKDLLRESQFKAQIEQPQQFVAAEIFWNGIMQEQRTKHFYLAPEQLNAPANSMWKTGFKELRLGQGSIQSQSEFIGCQRRSSYRFLNRHPQPRPEGAQGSPEPPKTQRETTLLSSVQHERPASSWTSSSPRRHHQSTVMWAPWNDKNEAHEEGALVAGEEGICLTQPPMQRQEEHSSLQDHFLICDVGKSGNFYTRNSVPKSMGKAKIMYVKSSSGNP